MKYPTCKDAKKALDHCIEKRWRKIVENGGGRVIDTPECALCKFDFKCFTASDWKFDVCQACPLFIFTNGNGCGPKSTYRRWVRKETRKNAQAMLDELIACRKHFFGE